MKKIKLESIIPEKEPSFERGANPFLSAVMRKIRKDYEVAGREDAPAAGEYHIASRYAGEPYQLPFIYFDTKGCKFDKAGACTMCNFGRNTKYTEDQTFEAVQSIIKSNEGKPIIMVVAAGSLLDDWEVSPEQRRRILEVVAGGKFEIVCTESRSEFITEEKVREMRAILGDNVGVEMGIGLETVDPIISKYSINKMFSPEQHRDAVKVLKDNGVEVFSHALLKPAFLTEGEAYDDVMKTIKWAFENGSDSAGIGIMNLKKGTLNYWLAERGEYRVPWLWTVAKIFKELSPEQRSRVTAFGFESGTPIEGEAVNCSKCSPDIKRILNQFIETRDDDILNQIEQYQCSCKPEWEKDMTKEVGPLMERLPEIYKKIATQFTGLGNDSVVDSLIQKSLPKQL